MIPAEMPVEPDCILQIRGFWYFSETVFFLYLFSPQISMSAVRLRATSMAGVSTDWVPLTVTASLVFMVMVSSALSWQVSNMSATRVKVTAREQQEDFESKNHCCVLVMGVYYCCMI